MPDDRPPRVILDCDPGHDDVIAMVVAAHCCELVGVTTVAGNAPLDRTTYNACVVRDALDLEVEVHAGAERPLVVEPRFAGFVHGESGLDGADLPEPRRGADSADAVEFIIDTCRAEPGLWLVPTGPLTNIALALRADPGLATRVAGVSLMGGGTFGNRTPMAEFNIWADPHAAAVVFGSGLDITMAGLDVTHQFLVTPERIDDVGAIGLPFTDLVADLFRFFSKNYISRHDHVRGAALHDPLAVMALTHPHLFSGTHRHVAIETVGDHTIGMTVIDRRDISDRELPNVHVLETVDADAAWQVVMEALGAVSAGGALTYESCPAQSVRSELAFDAVADSFPRQYARTQRLTLGEPRNLTVTPDGERVVFARSRGGSDPVNCLWVADVATGDETLLVDPIRLMDEFATDDADLPAEERARRERLREGAGGITSYATDDDVTAATFVLGGQLFVADLTTGEARHLDVPGPVFDPHLAPGGDRIAYVRGAELWITDLDGGAHRLAGPGDDEPDTVRWGSADFIAAEEMHRYRGFWWSPDGTAIAACRVDDTPVHVWHIADPATPSRPPAAVRYPAAGTPNPIVTLHVLAVDGGAPTPVTWDRDAFEYLAKVIWNDQGLAITVQSRNQRDLEVRAVDPTNGATDLVFVDHDDAWVELLPGTGSFVAPRTPVMIAGRDGASRLMVGDRPVSPPDIQVQGVIDAAGNRVIATGNPLDDASQLHVYRWTPEAGFEALTAGHGVHTAVVGGNTVVVRSATVETPGGRWSLPNGTTLTSHAERPLVAPNVVITTRHDHVPTTAVLLPHDHDGTPLPVLLDPYGGPRAQRVVRSHNAYCTSQWFADQGFAVVIADGRGTPGPGTAFERAVHLDLATGVLDDQVAALEAAADRHPVLDLDRVAIRGWSFGGYLAALAVLRRPDVFHAAIAGAPVTEWRLYDTHYTERYLGDPNLQPEVYDASSLLPLADRLTRPLLLVHGLADDNVVAAHTLQLSSALLAAGRPHEVLPLVGVTHMTPQETVAENLLLHQLDFLRRSLPHR